MVIVWIQNVHAVPSGHSRSQTASGVGGYRALVALEQFSGGLIALSNTFKDAETCLSYTAPSKSLNVPQAPPLPPVPPSSSYIWHCYG